jgi:hypothetical protein
VLPSLSRVAGRSVLVHTVSVMETWQVVAWGVLEENFPMGLDCSVVVWQPVDCFALKKQSFFPLGNTLLVSTLLVSDGSIAGLQRVMLTPQRRKSMEFSGSFSISLGFIRKMGRADGSMLFAKVVCTAAPVSVKGCGKKRVGAYGVCDGNAASGGLGRFGGEFSDGS